MKRSRHYSGMLALLAAMLVACGRGEQAQIESDEVAEPSIVQSAIESPDRFAGDGDEDVWRQPQAVLEFIGLEPGMQVLDYFAAAGFYSELLARTVGPSGSVIVYNNIPYAQFAGEKLVKRFADERIANAKVVTLPTSELALDPNSLDAVLFFLSYHDLYWKPKEATAPFGNPPQVLAGLFAALKPGGVVVVIDHVANPGATSDGDAAIIADSLHRIDPAKVKSDFASAGFIFEAESDALKSDEDDRTKPVFDEAVRFKTDRFMHKFRKPS